MKREKKRISMVVSAMVALSMSTMVFASNPSGVWSSPVNLKGQKPISAYVPNSESNDGENIQTKNIRAGNVRFVHDSGFEYSGNGSSGDPDERVWGETSHTTFSGKPVDGYTRARYERGDKIKADSGRVWDSDDGKITGYSKAKSHWVSSGVNFYTGHTYYGNE